MVPVPAAYPRTAVPRGRRQVSGFTWPESARKSLLICRSRCRTDLMGGPVDARRHGGEAEGQVAACIFLLTSRRAPRASHRLTGPTAAAPHKSLVNINQKTSARRTAGDRGEAGTHWDRYRNWRAATACGAARGQNIKPQQARRMPHACSNARFHSWTASGHKSRRPPSSIVNPCKSLLIPHPRGSARGGRRIVKACRSLLTHAFRPHTEP